MTFEEKIEKYSASSSTTKIREQRANFLFLTDGSLVYDYEKFKYDIDAAIICEKDSHKGIIIGKQGSMLKKIGTKAREDIEKLVEMQVNLKLWVKVKKDWRDSDFELKNFGYKKEDLN